MVRRESIPRESQPSFVDREALLVEGAAQQTSDLIILVNSFHPSSSMQTALDNKLQDVLTAITDGQTATACSGLTDFIGHVQQREAAERSRLS